MQTPSVPVNRPMAASNMGTSATIPPMGFGEAVSAGFSKYIQFSGRSRRAEYWYWVLFITLLNCAILLVVPLTLGVNWASNLYALASIALFLPNLGVLIRRLHDTDRSGWWFLLPLTIIGAFVLLVWLCQEGTKGQNRFGPRTT